MTIYDIYRYTLDEIAEFEKLLELVYKLGVEDRVQESFFQFSPNLIMDESKRIPGFGEHETWFSSHKRSVIIEIIVYLIENTIEDEYIQEEMINDLINEEMYTDFINNSLYSLTKEEIIQKFKSFIKN